MVKLETVAWRIPLAGLLAILGACSSASAVQDCGGSSVEIGSSSCLDLEGLGSLVGQSTALEVTVGSTLALADALMPIDDLRIRVISDGSRTIPGIGAGGFTVNGSEILIYLDPGRADIEQVISVQLPGIVAHELHHAKRMRTAGYGSTLGEAAISEGLADHFSVEVVGGAPPPWSTALSPSEIDSWTNRVLEASGGPYSHDTWFFGIDPSIPRWTGYTVGYELVRIYLEADPNRRASGLFAEPAESFLADLKSGE